MTSLASRTYVDPATSTSTDLAFAMPEMTVMNMIDAVTTTLSLAAIVSTALQTMTGPRRRMTMKKAMNPLVVSLIVVPEDIYTFASLEISLYKERYRGSQSSVLSIGHLLQGGHNRRTLALYLTKCSP